MLKESISAHFSSNFRYEKIMDRQHAASRTTNVYEKLSHFYLSEDNRTNNFMSVLHARSWLDDSLAVTLQSKLNPIYFSAVKGFLKVLIPRESFRQCKHSFHVH